jgi:hypothetical protein
VPVNRLADMNAQEALRAKSDTSLHFSFIGGLNGSAQPQIHWAISELRTRLGERAVELHAADFSSGAHQGGSIVVFALSGSDDIRRTAKLCGVELPSAPESFAIFQERKETANVLFVYGADTRGLIYAITELADRVRFTSDLSTALDFAVPLVETPTAKVRSISKCFQSEVEDLPWFHDREGWEEYFTLLVTHRFNRFSLTLGMQYNYPYGNEFVSDVYFHLAYPFLVSVPGHPVTITNLTDDERRRNLDTLKFIAREADRRGLEFQLALWTQSYDFDDCPNAKHQITGLGPGNIAAYCRDALAMILAEIPEISGLTLRVHVESGIPEGDYEFWRTYFSAVTGAGRAIRLDLHAKGIDEKITDIALATGMPVSISPKYTSEHLGLPYHQASIRALELPVGDEMPADPNVSRDMKTLYAGRDAEKHADKWKFSEGTRKFMRYSYGDLMREDRPYDIVFRIWPGTIRILLWGDPVLAGGYGRNSTFCGAKGVELCEPLSFKGRMGTGVPGSRTGYRDAYLSSRRDWQKFEYTYRVWGRSLYDPEAEPEAFQRFLDSKFGKAADNCGKAIGNASRILPLIVLAHTPTSSNNSYWPEMYENMSIVHEAPSLPYGYELSKPARFGTVGSCDPQLFMSPSDFAACLHEGRGIRKLSPLTWANWLESHATAAAVEMARALDVAGDPQAELHLVALDVTILAAIGRFFADKVRAAVLWEYHLLSGEARSAEKALDLYRSARDAWAEAAATCQEVYLPDITYGPHSWLRGRWDDRLPAIDQDISDMESLVAKDRLAHPGAGSLATSQIARVLGWSTSQLRSCRHTPPAGFVRGEAIEISVAPFAASRRAVTLHYRHVNQAEPWRCTDMTWRDGEYRSHIPGEYTGTLYPIMYYFEFYDGDVSGFYPGIAEDLSNCPYFSLSGNGAQSLL